MTALSDEQLDALARKHTRVHDQTTHGWGTVPVAKLDHRAFAHAVLAAAGVTAWREPLSQDQHTQAQAAAVMLLHGTPEQQAEALRATGVKASDGKVAE